MAIALPDEPGVLPVAVVTDAHVDSLDRCGTGPGNAADRYLAGVDHVIGFRLGNERANSLERDRVSCDSTVAFALVEVAASLVMACERFVDGLDVGEPLH